MDPPSTGTGLTTAGQCRAQTVAGGVPALPGGNYIESYSTTATAILTTLSAELTGRVGSGLANTASTVSKFVKVQPVRRQDPAEAAGVAAAPDDADLSD